MSVPATDIRALTRLRGLALASTALIALTGPLAAQTWTDPTSPSPGGTTSPIDRNRPDFGLGTGQNGLPALRGVDRARTAPNAFGQNSLGGDPTGGESSGGTSGGGEGLSRLPRFRSTGGQTVSSLTGTTVRPTPSLLRQRAAPARRLGSPTRRRTQLPTQDFIQDLRLTPVVQAAVSGVPLPGTAATAGLLRAFPRFGLVTPTATFFGSAFSGVPTMPDPAYAPLGIKLGTFTILPAFEQSVGYDGNPAQTIPTLARGSAVLRSEGEVAFRSDWSSSELVGDLRGGYSEFPSDEAASRPNASGVTRLRIDANRDTRVDVETRFLVDTQRFGSPDLGVGAATTVNQRPIFATFGATAGVTENFNRLQISLRGTFDRQVFEDTRLSDGTPVIQSDRNANQYGLILRAGYEISPVFTPFVEALVDTRVYDTPADQLGLRRDSDGIGFNVGATVELTRTLAGEISAGLQNRDYVDPTLRSIRAPIVNAALVWSASPLTTVRFSQQTGIVETAVPGSSGVFTEAATIEVQHDLLRNLSLVGGLSFVSADYQGVNIRERGYSALVRADYRFNRWLTFRGSYIHQQIASTAPNASFSDDIFLLGVRVNP